MSQPPPASADGMPRTSAKKARTFSASGENTMAWIPVITPRSYLTLTQWHRPSLVGSASRSDRPDCSGLTGEESAELLS
jgi:hypothetical protein